MTAVGDTVQVSIDENGWTLDPTGTVTATVITIAGDVAILECVHDGVIQTAGVPLSALGA